MFFWSTLKIEIIRWFSWCNRLQIHSSKPVQYDKSQAVFDFGRQRRSENGESDNVLTCYPMHYLLHLRPTKSEGIWATAPPPLFILPLECIVHSRIGTRFRVSHITTVATTTMVRIDRCPRRCIPACWSRVISTPIQSLGRIYRIYQEAWGLLWWLPI